MLKLLTAKRQRTAPRSLHELRTRAISIEEALLTENTDWLRQISFSVLEPVA